MIQNMHSISEFKAHSVFQGKRKLPKNPGCKKYIVNTVKFLVKLFFRASASCSKMLNGEKIFNAVYVHLGVVRVNWASVVCHLD